MYYVLFLNQTNSKIEGVTLSSVSHAVSTYFKLGPSLTKFQDTLIYILHRKWGSGNLGRGGGAKN